MIWQLLALTSALFSALAAVFEKKTLFKTEPVVFSLLLSVFTLILSLPFLSVVHFAAISFSTLLILYLKSILGAVAFLLVMFGIKHNELSNSLPLLVFTPAVVAILAYPLLGEAIGIWAILGMILLLIGTYFLQLDKTGNWLSPFFFVQRHRAQWYIIGAIMLFSATSILDKTILKNYKLQPEAFLPIQQFFFTINFLCIYSFRKVKTQNVKSELVRSWKLILLVAVFAIVYRYSHILAVKSGAVALVLSIKRTSVFFAALIGGTYFKEQNLLRRLFAVIIMVGGAILVILI